MKRTTLLSLFVLLFFCGQAQWVNIPDSNFGIWLTTNYPTCMQGDPQSGFQMDTSCNDIINATDVNCSYNYIYDLEGIQWFKNLQTLDCFNNNISNLGSLPNTLEYLNCNNNQLTNIAAFPSSLSQLFCASNSLDSLPSLPNQLYYLVCADNKLTYLPALPNSLYSVHCLNNMLTFLPVLPNALHFLNCEYNQITGLPAIPDSLKELYCGNNLLSNQLPPLPDNLQVLYCDRNDLKLNHLPSPLPSKLNNFNCSGNYHLDSLPILPDSIKFLSCFHCNISFLPNIPPFIEGLDIRNNLFTSIQPLPKTLRFLNCSFNNLSSLPQLPSNINSLSCQSNPNLTCLPNRLDSIDGLWFSNTSITCMPNRFPCISFDIDPNSLPLCDPISGCSFYYNIGGNVHQSTTTDCVQDSLSHGNGLKNIKLRLLQNGQTIQQTYAYNLGEYSFNTDSNTVYKVQIDTAGIPFALNCPISGERNVALTNTDSMQLNQNFGLNCKGVDLGVLSIYGRFRVGTQSTVNINAGDIIKYYYNANCANNVTGTVTITLNGDISYVAPAFGALTPTAVTGNILSYTISDFSSIPENAFDFVVATDIHAISGSLACINVNVSTATDINLANNVLSQCFTIFNSFDPNAKEVYPATITSTGGWLTYTVHFQNTGNDTAYSITVRDTLSNAVDVGTFQFLASSHDKHFIQLKGNAVSFLFPQINLVDSATNAFGSEGWFQFRVKAKSNLVPQTAINNTAYIYFDFNAPIVTNTATTNVCSPSYSSFKDTICNGSSRTYNGISLTQSGAYNDTLINTSGCDSIITLNLFVRPLNSKSLFDSICYGSSILFNGLTLTQSGIYKDTLTNTWGCDSIVSLHLTIKPTPDTPSIVRNGNQLVTSYTNGYTYNWYFNNQPIAGQKDSMLTIAQNGLYTVAVIAPDNCGAIAKGINITNVGIQTLNNYSFSVYPNPNKGNFTLLAPNNIGDEWSVVDVLGRLIANGFILQESEFIQLNDNVSGVYILKCGNQQIRLVIRD